MNDCHSSSEEDEVNEQTGLMSTHIEQAYTNDALQGSVNGDSPAETRRDMPRPRRQNAAEENHENIPIGNDEQRVCKI